VYSSGSNIFGNSLDNTQQFTGSMSVTGSLTVVTAGTELQVTSTGVNLGNALIDSHIISGSLRVNPNGLFVSGSGNVGIGTTSPTRTLQVNGFISAFDGTTRTEIVNGGGVGYFGTQTTHPLAFQTDNTERMRITSVGNVGIGTTNPSEKFFVNAGTGARGGMALSGEYPYFKFNTITSNANARNWAFSPTWAEFGDFVLARADAKDGDPLTSASTAVLYFARGGAATFSSSVTATSATLSGPLNINGSYIRGKTVTGTANGTDVILGVFLGYPGGIAGTVEVFAMAGIIGGGSISSRVLTFNFAGGNIAGGSGADANVSNSVLGTVAAASPAGTNIDSLSASITSLTIDSFNISISNSISGTQITNPTYYIQVTYGLHANASIS
jgi:hypothetical protein